MVYTAVPTQMQVDVGAQVIAFAKSQFKGKACGLARTGITNEIGVLTAGTSTAVGYGSRLLGYKDPVDVSLTPTSLTQLHSET